MNTIEPNTTEQTFCNFYYFCSTSFQFQFPIESMCSIASPFSYPRRLLATLRCKQLKSSSEIAHESIELTWSSSSTARIAQSFVQFIRWICNMHMIWRSAEKLNWMLINYDNWFSQLPWIIPLCNLLAYHESFTFLFFRCVLVECSPFIDNSYACTLNVYDLRKQVVLNVKFLQFEKNSQIPQVETFKLIINCLLLSSSVDFVLSIH